jgi:hypothetical protein
MVRAYRLDHVGFTARDVEVAGRLVRDLGPRDLRLLCLEDPEGHQIELTTCHR